MSLYRLNLFLLGLFLFLIAGCGGSGTSLDNTGPVEQAAVENTTGAYPDFTTDTLGTSPTHRTSDDEYAVDGNGYVVEYGAYNRTGPGDSFVLVSSNTAHAWAIYGVTGLTADRPVTLALDVEVAELTAGDGEFLPLKYWVGVADFTTYQWYWYGSYDAAETATLNSAELADRFVSAEGDLRFLIVVPAARPATIDHYAVQINSATVTTSPGYLQNKPHYAWLDSAEVGTGGGGYGAEEQYVHVAWTHLAPFGAWDEQNAADEYLIYRYTPGAMTASVIGSVPATTTSYIDPTDNDPGAPAPVPGKTYLYSLRASNEAGMSSYSEQLPAFIPLFPPAEVYATDGSYTDRVVIEWTAAVGAMGYEIYRDSTDSPYATIGSYPTTWEDTGVTPGVEYNYWIRSLSNGVRSELSSFDTGYAGTTPVTPDPPTDVSATDGDHADKVVLSWTAATGATGYEVFRDNTETPVATLGPVTTWDDTTVTPGVEYTYWVKTVNDTLVSILSDPDTGYAGNLPVTPDPPTDVSATDGDYPDKVVVTWTAATGATGYNIYRDNTAGEPFATVGAVTSWEDTTVTPGPYHTYWLQSLDGETGGELSDPDSGYAWSLPEDVELVCYPAVCDATNDELTIMYPDPVVRRDPRVYYDSQLASLMPSDPIAYNDILKTNGDEFALQVSGGIWPRVAVVATSDPATITSLDDGMSGIFCYLPDPSRLVIDISVITNPGAPGDPDEDYSLRVFDANGISPGHARFQYDPDGSGLTAPTGINWGVNVWDRAAGAIDDRAYDGQILNGATIGTNAPSPDVIWVEFQDGWYFDFDHEVSGVYSTSLSPEDDNLLLKLTDNETDAYMYLGISPRIAGLDPAGAGVIAIHATTRLSFLYPEIPGWPGVFDSGHTYTLELEDPHFSGTSYTFTQHLYITGPNPNLI